MVRLGRQAHRQPCPTTHIVGLSTHQAVSSVHSFNTTAPGPLLTARALQPQPQLPDEQQARLLAGIHLALHSAPTQQPLQQHQRCVCAVGVWQGRGLCGAKLAAANSNRHACSRVLTGRALVIARCTDGRSPWAACMSIKQTNKCFACCPLCY